MLILMNCIKYVYRLGSSQRSPQTMHAWEGMHNYIILREYVSLSVKLLYVSAADCRFCIAPLCQVFAGYVDHTCADIHKYNYIYVYTVAIHKCIHTSIHIHC